MSTETCETCNTYNLLKLTRGLFAVEPDAGKMDFYERALYNHILASQEPQTGMFVYLMSLKPGHFKTYSTPEDSFWCCVGTGMENHSKYGDTIYFQGADSLYVNLFIASELSWKAKGMSVRQETTFPESDQTRLTFKCDKPVPLTLKIRRPAWAQSPLTIRVNGRKQDLRGEPGSYLALNREWRDRDKVEIQLPMTLHTEALPAVSNIVALLYGPIVLAGELGTNVMPVPFARGQTDFSNLPVPIEPVFVCAARKVSAHVAPVSGRRLTFRTRGIGRPNDVTLIPLYQLHRQRYSVYWKLLSESDWRAQTAELAAAETRRVTAEARLVDAVRPGEQQSETDHHFQGGDTQSGSFDGRKWRHATDWFSYEVKVLPDQPLQLVCTFWGSDKGSREFDVVVDGKIIATQKLNNIKPGEFFDAMYPVPTEFTRGKETITVKFAAHSGNLAGGLFGLRVVRGK